MINILGWTLNLNKSDKKVKELTRFFCVINSMFRSSAHFFFSTCHSLKIWFESSRVELYRNDLIEGKQTLLQVRARFALSGARVIEGKITVNVTWNSGEIDFGSS